MPIAPFMPPFPSALRHHRLLNHGLIAPRATARAVAVALVIGLGLAAAAQAEKSDRGQKLNYVADSAKFDEQHQLYVLSGNVEITKGTIVIRANQIEVRQTPQGYQSAVATGWPTKRAYFRQKREGSDEYIEGEAERLEYDSRNDTVKLVNQAVMRRYVGTVLADEVAGNTISYDNPSEVFQVLGGASSTAPAGRVRGVLAPRSTGEPPTAPGAAASDVKPSGGAQP